MSLRLLDAEVDAIQQAIDYSFETGYQDKGIALIESVAALTTIETVLALAIRREKVERTERIKEDD